MTYEAWNAGRLPPGATVTTSANSAPQSQPMPPRLLQALARRNFRAPTDMDDLIAMAANIIAEDGFVIERLQAKLAACAGVDGTTSNMNCLEARRIDRAYAICEPCNTGFPERCLYKRPACVTPCDGGEK